MSNSWVGTRVRKGEKYGTVIHDDNYQWRILSIKMDDGTREVNVNLPKKVVTKLGQFAFRRGANMIIWRYAREVHNEVVDAPQI